MAMSAGPAEDDAPMSDINTTPLVDVMLSSQAETVGFGMDHLLGHRYVRLQRRLAVASDDLDDASAGNLARLREEAEGLIAEQDAAIDALCAQLTSRSSPDSMS